MRLTSKLKKLDKIFVYFIAGLLATIANLYTKFLNKDIDPFETNMYRITFAGITAFIILCLIKKNKKEPIFPKMNNNLKKEFLIILIGGMLLVLGNTSHIYCVQNYKVSETTSFQNAFGVLVTATIGCLVFKEKINLNNVLAILLIVVGVFIYR